jgi:ABC-type transport system involved in cytochrome bd biosynthesis fused ATPase/permease subunit
MKKAYRYPGAQSFSENQQNIFFGRENEVEEILDLIRLEKHLVIYGKSGMGKSSLLNAGLVPRILSDGRFEPVFIRFHAYTDGREDLPLDIARETLMPETSNENNWLSLLLPEDNSLWRALKLRQINQDINQKRGVLLIFDQFDVYFAQT